MDMKIEQELNHRSIKPTAMRILVLQYFMEQTRAVSLHDIESEFVNADKSTLFRTLKTFEKNQLVHTIDDGTKQIKYALCLSNCQCEAIDQHYHFHCLNCENTYCLTSLNIPTIDLPQDFTMKQANLVIKGRCANCKV